MVKNLYRRLLPMLLAVILVISVMPLGMLASATTVNVLDGQITVTDSANSITVSNDVVTIKATGSLFSTKTNTVTITNESDATANLSFSYSASTYNSFTVDGASASASGTYSKILDAGASVTLVLVSNSGMSNRTATLTLSNFSLVAAADASNVTFGFDSTYGSITVDGAAVTDGAAKEIPLAGASLVATPVSGATFLGWTNAADGLILSTATSYTITPANDMTVKAMFVGANSAPYFMLGDATQKSEKTGLLNLGKKYYYIVSATHIFDTLAAATEASKTSNSKYIVLANSGTLPAGDYTIPSGTTLLIPFDSANTLFTTEALSSATYTTPTAYRTLKLAAGANINIEGAMSLSAKHKYAAGPAPNMGGTPTGPISFVDMTEGSNITVKNGGKLYAYGYITGSGSVTAKSGATVYEYFQIMDFRGGSQSTDDNMKKKGVFPLSQYYVQNIEAPLTLEYGSTEYAYTSIYMSSAEFSSSVAFISSKNAMFNLTSGTVTKRYDGSTDRLRIEANGNMTVSGIKMQVGTSNLDSSDYELPVNSNITVTIDGGTITMNQDMALLPGSEILIGEDATCVLGSGNNVYVYDADQWGGYIYNATSAGTKNAKVVPVKYAPGRTYTRTEADLVDAKIQVEGIMDASNGHLYTTTGGANIFSTGNGVAKLTAGTETVTHQLQQVGSTFVDIPIVSAKLKNADGSYVQSGTDTYNYANGKWNCTNHSYDAIITEPTCSEQGYTTYVCCACGNTKIDDYVDTIDHNYSSVTVDATCTTDGYTEYTCIACGHSYTADEVDAPGHNYSSVTTPPTCADEGYTTHTCSKCGNSYVDSYVDTVAHSYGEWIIDAPADCTNEGFKHRACSECSFEETDNIPALGHSHNAVVTAPTCNEKGYTTYTCSCGDTYTADEVAALGHTPGDEPTCTTNQVCTVCGTELAPANGHSHNAVVTAPTCNEKGYTTYTCSCGDTYTADEVAALGHTPGDEPTCTTNQVCTVCGTELAPANDHDYSDEYTVDVEATHTTEGSKSRHCAHCESVTDVTVIPVLCDIDGNGVVDTYEVTMVRQHLLGKVDFDEATFNAFDMDGSGEINIVDLVMLKKYISTL